MAPYFITQVTRYSHAPDMVILLHNKKHLVGGDLIFYHLEEAQETLCDRSGSAVQASTSFTQQTSKDTRTLQ